MYKKLLKFVIHLSHDDCEICACIQDGDFVVESVDQIVYNQLNSVESEMIDKKLLMDIYTNL